MTPDRNVVEEKVAELCRQGNHIYQMAGSYAITRKELRTALTEVADHTRAAERERLRGVVYGLTVYATRDDTKDGEERYIPTYSQVEILKALTPPEAPAPNDTTS